MAPSSFQRFPLLVSGLLLSPLLPQAACAQAGTPLPNFYTTYLYKAYTVYDNTGTEPPTQVQGVGGSLTFRPAGTYEKRFSIAAPNGLMHFRQDGTFTITGDSIRFAFTDAKGPDVQRGTFQLAPATHRLTLTILGYPAGNKGVYELVEAPAPPAPPQPAPRSKPSPKHRR